MAHPLLGVVAAAILAGTSPTTGPVGPRALRVGITPVLVEKQLDIDKQLVAYLGEKLGMDRDPRGRVLLAGIGFKRFVPASDRSFDGIREMRRVVGERRAAPVDARARALP